MSAQIKFLPKTFLIGLGIMLICLETSCLIPFPRAQVVANCEIHGSITMSGSGAPVENVMIFAMYEFNKDKGKLKNPLTFGPFYSDSEGRFTVPKFYKKQWYLEHLYMGDCGGDLLFIHPSLGAYSVLICTEDYPPQLPFKELNVRQNAIDAKWTKEQIRYSYKAIERLPEALQSVAWSHVNSDMRPDQLK